MKNLNNQSGRSMIEMLGVLAIIGVLSVGGIAGYSKAMLKYKTNKTIDQIAMLTTNIRTLYAQQNTFDGLNVANAIKMGVVPDEMQASPSALTNPFAGSVTIDVTYSVPGKAGESRAFVIGVDGIPKEACMAFMTSDWGSNYSSGLIGMSMTNDYNSSGTDDTIGAGTGEQAGQQVITTAGTKKNAAALLLNNTTARQIYAGADCSDTGLHATEADATSGVYCAKNIPIQVHEASKGCNCAGSQCSVAIKYY